MKKLFVYLLVCVMVFGLAACGNGAPTDSTTGTQAPSAGETAVSADNEEGQIEVDKELFDVVITLPADMVGETTQEELNAEVDQDRLHSATLNEDGSVTYEMSKRQHKALLADLAEELDGSFQEMAGSEDFPKWKSVTHNDDFTHFTVTTTSEELDLMESFSVMTFYLSGGMYNVMAGESDATITVDFVNADSGEIISTANSDQMEE